MAEKSKPSASERREKERRLPPSTWATPGTAEGDLETVEADLKEKENKRADESRGAPHR